MCLLLKDSMKKGHKGDTGPQRGCNEKDQEEEEEGAAQKGGARATSTPPNAPRLHLETDKYPYIHTRNYTPTLLYLCNCYRTWLHLHLLWLFFCVCVCLDFFFIFLQMCVYVFILARSYIVYLCACLLFCRRSAVLSPQSAVGV